MTHDATPSARLIAFYLPQYHPVRENDEWWGPGFTEWVSVAKARPMFRGHEQPRLPGELGFYDLRLPEIRAAQAALAREHGIEGFCYWHYWLGGGRRLLQRPFDEVLASGQPDFPFCLGWANHDWVGVWFGSQGKILARQTYPGEVDAREHFDYLLKAFSDPRYITIDGKPLYYIYHPAHIPGVRGLLDLWRELAHAAGLKGLYLVGEGIDPGDCTQYGFDATAYSYHRQIAFRGAWGNPALRKLLIPLRELVGRPQVHSYHAAMKYFLKQGEIPVNEFPAIVTGWDSTPRLGSRGIVLTGATPQLFREHVREAIARVAHKPAAYRILFVKSWNEWAEGNYLEPDRSHGRAYLEVVRDEIGGRHG